MSDDGRLAAILERWTGHRVLCIGDLMLDRYVYGRVERMSPEAPIPVLAVERETMMLGGAGNVARNVAALGGRVSLVAMVGDDEAGHDVMRVLEKEPNLETSLVTVPGRRTTVKTRYVAGVQQLLRADNESDQPVTRDIEDRLIHAALDELEGVDAVLLSDYAKGTLAPRLVAAVVARARVLGKLVVADPKGLDFTRYRGVSVLKPNSRELAAATGLACGSNAEVETAARAALALAEADALLVTRSERGMTLVEASGGTVHLTARAREVYDVSGAGDTALAAFGLALAAGATLAEAAGVANAAASLVVGKVGTAVVYPEDLSTELASEQLASFEAKMMGLAPALDRVAQWRARGLRVGFTNGCFDLIHPGHISLLAQARAACDRLIVGLNTDASVQRLKGEGRPINTEVARAIVLASLATVDLVVQFDEDTPMRLIEAIRPELLVKGADYSLERVVGADFVTGYGGKIMLATLAPGHSTTGTIAKLSNGAKPNDVAPKGAPKGAGAKVAS